VKWAPKNTTYERQIDYILIIALKIVVFQKAAILKNGIESNKDEHKKLGSN
jgi:hypothetical protein